MSGEFFIIGFKKTDIDKNQRMHYNMHVIFTKESTGVAMV